MAVSFAFMRGAAALVAAALLAMLIASRLRAAARNQPPPPPLELDRQRGEVRLTATVHPAALDARGHVVAWKEGGAAATALFTADASDHDVRVAFDGLRVDGGGIQTGQEGAPIEVFVQWAGSGGRVPLAELLSAGGQEVVRLALDRPSERPASEVESGCILCLEPRGHVAGIRERPVRDVIYSALQSKLPPLGTTVTLILKRMEAT